MLLACSLHAPCMLLACSSRVGRFPTDVASVPFLSSCVASPLSPSLLRPALAPVCHSQPWSGADLDDAFDPGLLSGGSSAVWRPALPITPQQLPRSASVGTLERHSSSVSFGTSRSAIGARSSPYPKPIAIPGRVSPSSAPRTPPAKMSPMSPLSPLSPPLHASSPLGLPPLSSPSMASSPPPTSPLSPGHRLAGPGRPRGWILASGKMVGAGSTVIRRAEERTPRLQVQGRNAQPPPPMPEHAWYAAWLQAQSPGARVAVSSAEVLSL